MIRCIKKQYKSNEMVKFFDILKEEEPYKLYKLEASESKKELIKDFNDIYKKIEEHYYPDISQYCYNSCLDDLDYLLYLKI